LLSANFKFLNFKAKRGISETKVSDSKIVSPIRTSGISIIDAIKLSAWKVLISGNDMKIKQFAGVGNPIKLSLCLSSILNFANLYADKEGIASAINE
jgi:hypothetical protein